MLKSITLKNYRNLKNIKTDFSEQGNLIIAPNGSGKTNFLEAIHYSLFGSSFKPLNTSIELIGPEETFAKASTKWDLDHLEVTVSNINDTLTRKFVLNKKKFPISKISSKFPLILFAPTTVDLVAGEPHLRRDDMDHYLSVSIPGYKENLSKYKIILRNRNAVLKGIREGKLKRNLLDYWNDEITKLSEILFKLRNHYFVEILPFFHKAKEILYKDVEKDFQISADYTPNQKFEENNYAESLKKKFEENIEKEIIVGKTLYGIHKDDFTISLNSENLRFKGSRGQQRIGALILKMAQILNYFEKYKKFPLLVLDDIMSELDQANRQKVGQYILENKIQFILTTADKMEIPDFLFEVVEQIQID